MTTSSSNSSQRRVVITGVGIVSPLGNDADQLVQSLRAGESGIRPFTRVPQNVMCVSHGGEAIDFTGAIGDYGPLDKPLTRAIRKNTKMMCREIQMGVGAAQLAFHDGGLNQESRDRDRTGTIYGVDYIMSQPKEFTDGIGECLDDDGKFQFTRWGQEGKPKVTPLWLLKYLPNMPASHVAIYNDLRGPSNSITMREAAPGAAIFEAYSTIIRGNADVMMVGSTGSRIHELRSLHASMQEEMAADCEDPTKMCRPFDTTRDGSVLGEGAGAILCETLEHAEARGANILGEVVGYGSSAVGPNFSNHFLQTAFTNVYRAALGSADVKDIGHIHAHGLGSVDCDQQEAAAIAEVFGPADEQPPVTAAKSNFGNLSAGSGMIEIVASIKALGGELFPIRNCESLDEACPINACTESGVPAGDQFISANVTPQGQASAVRIRKFA